MWNLTNYKGKHDLRKEFEYEVYPKFSDKTVKKISLKHTYLRRIFVELPVVFVSLTITCACYYYL